jgi:hypothetical protein
MRMSKLDQRRILSQFDLRFNPVARADSTPENEQKAIQTKMLVALYRGSDPPFRYPYAGNNVRVTWRHAVSRPPLSVK